MASTMRRGPKSVNMQHTFLDSFVELLQELFLREWLRYWGEVLESNYNLFLFFLDLLLLRDIKS